MDEEKVKYRIAVATSDGIVINQHFGRAERFMVYELWQDDTIHFAQERNVIALCQSGSHDAIEMRERCRYFSDCKYVLSSRIGQSAANALEQEGIIPMELPGMIEESIKKLVAYEKVQQLFVG